MVNCLILSLVANENGLMSLAARWGKNDLKSAAVIDALACGRYVPFCGLTVGCEPVFLTSLH